MNAEVQPSLHGAAVNRAAAEVIRVSADQLPVYCPGPHAPLWSMHPRVYIDLGPTGQAKCPYCGALYVLDGPAPAGH